MKITEIIGSLQKGKELKNSAKVKKINIAVNIIAVAVAGIVQIVGLPVSDASIMHIGDWVQNSMPYLVALFNVLSHVSTSAKIGFTAKKGEANG